MFSHKGTGTDIQRGTGETGYVPEIVLVLDPWAAKFAEGGTKAARPRSRPLRTYEGVVAVHSEFMIPDS
jgi:hypothetical protein